MCSQALRFINGEMAVLKFNKEISMKSKISEKVSLRDTPQNRRWAMWAVPYLGLTACSGTPPIDAMATAEMAVNRALEAKASQLAPLDLRMARDKLFLAKVNMGQENYVQARRFAEEARVDARVAEARARAQSASDSNRDAQQTIKRLQRDLEQKALDQ